MRENLIVNIEELLKQCQDDFILYLIYELLNNVEINNNLS